MFSPSVWNSSGIETLLDSLIECSGMSASLYDKEGKLVIRKFSTSKLIQHLVNALGSSFMPKVEALERDALKSFIASEDIKKVSLLKRLELRVLPLRLMGEVEGYVMVGYIFTRFPSPEDCQVLAREFNDSYLSIWHHARADQPSTVDKLDKFSLLFRVVLESHINGVKSGLQLQAADQMKDDLLSIVSHELRTPLAAGILRLQMLQRRLSKGIPEDLDIQLSQALGSLRNQEFIINDLLDVAKISRGELKYNFHHGNLSSLVSECFAEMQPLIEQKGLSFELELPRKEIFLDYDELRLKQVILNLLNNAYKFTEEGSIQFKLSNPKGKVLIEVIDSGVGLSEQEASRIFFKFVQSSHSGNIKGLGLGLFIAEQIIRVHRGTITAISKGLMMGTTFRVEMPENLSVRMLGASLGQ